MSADNPTTNGLGVGLLEGLSHGNIGNYKGVMLCNRPNEPGELPMRER